MQGAGRWVTPQGTGSATAWGRPASLRIAGPLVIATVLAAGCGGGSRSREAPSGAAVLGTQGRELGGAPIVDALGGFLGAGYVFTQEEHTASRIERTEHLLEERFGLGATGSVYSPNFLSYEAAGVVGPSQDWSSDASVSTFDTGELYEADVGLHLFPRRFHPLDLQYTRFEDLQPRVFLSKLEIKTETARAAQRIELPDGTLRFEATRREIEQETLGFEAEPFLDTIENTLGASGEYRITPHQSVTASYAYRDVTQNLVENDFRAHSALGTHSLFFDEDHRHRLNSRVEGNFQEGDLDQDLFRWNEVLTSRLTERLEGDAGISYEKNDTNFLDLEVYRAEGGLHHRLYESLDSAVRLRAERLVADEQSTTDTAGSTVSLNYRKRTPVGILRLGYVNDLERRLVENEQGGAIDEPHTFPVTPPEEVRLDNSSIDPASIFITDPSGLIVYREGIDYTIREDAGGFTIITRLFTGNIPPGGFILVDYVFQSGADFTLDTIRHSVRAEHEFLGGWTPFFSYRDQDQRVSDFEGPGTIVAVDERSIIGGLEWRRPPHLVSAEYENRESTVLPFDAFRLRAQGSARFGAQHTLTGDLTQAWIFYRDPDRDVNVTQGAVRWRTNTGGKLSFFLDGNVRYEDDSLQGTSFAYSTGTGVEYRWRRMIFSLRADYREIRGVTSDFYGAEVGFWIVRTFGEPPRFVRAAVDRFIEQ